MPSTDCTTFAPIVVAELMDELCAAVDAARAAAGDDARWQNAISNAWEHILQAETIEYRASDHAMRYHSESGSIYQANGSCSCTAYLKGQPCKHRAAARLVRRALELAEQPAQAEPAQAAPAAAGQAAELAALQGEIYDSLLAAGLDWTDAHDQARAQAAEQLPGLLAYAREWDAAAARQRITRGLSAARGQQLAA